MSGLHTMNAKVKRAEGFTALVAVLKRLLDEHKRLTLVFPYANSNPAIQEQDIKNGLPEPEADATGEP